MIQGKRKLSKGATTTAKGKPWTDEKPKPLKDKAGEGLNSQQICDSGKMFGRTLYIVVKQSYGSIAITRLKGS